MNTSWITLYPQWYVSERNLIARSYPHFRVDEGLLDKGTLCYYGELIVRPSGGARRHPVQLHYPQATPFELPIVTPLKALPEFDDKGVVNKRPIAEFYDRRHQMPRGALCLFQRETRGPQGGESIQVIDVLRRAERWFLGLHTGHWPPDSYESELEPHFLYGGDVLLTKTFYSREIGGAGEFYMVRDMRRFVDGVSFEEPPLIVTAITQSTGSFQSVFDAREDLENIFPWIRNEAWNPEAIAESHAKGKQNDAWNLVTEHGYWWALPGEPQPFRSGQGLLRELEKVAPEGDAWKMLCTTLGPELTTFRKHFFALRYPGRDHEFEWLVLYMPEQAKPTADGGLLLASDDGEKRRVFENTPVACYRVHGARPDELHLRNTTVVTTRVRQKTVALIGLGALGSKIAELLAQAGVRNFRLCDPDNLGTGNVSRHIGGLSDFGARKTRIVSTRLFDINPYLTIDEVRNASAVSSLDDLTAFIGPADITISTTADENAESAINQVAVLNRKTVLYGRALRRASMGRVFLVRPGTDPCKACLGRYAAASRDAAQSPQDWIEISERHEDTLLHECGRPVIPASAVDLSFIAALISRTALNYLEERELPANHWIWSSEPATEVDHRLDRSLSTLPFTLSRHAHCPICQEPEVRAVVLSDEAREFITAEAQSSISMETGGILLGFVDAERQAVVLRATGPGPKATKSSSCFDRDVDFVQGELQKAMKELGSKGVYLGEWHSHLDPDPQPSPRDITSMCGIAAATNYATRCPVLLIAGINPKTAGIAALKSWSFPLGGRIYPIDNHPSKLVDVPAHEPDNHQR